ncbi:YvrJ family protein [Geomicrobium sediminis]|uniref:YvrJ family protein n=1 Tax=Geomicrobium sediminis TaxID=1347788 RepID=A0ABS2PBW2_9BACL|nr:YvrJ family protein [Geomicrobium sediminis]MBM7632888.1 hypothetical protein [Geomicrobium sediminis]
MIEISSLIEIMSKYGFPIAITLYLLFRFERRLERLERLFIEKVSERNDDESSKKN